LGAFKQRLSFLHKVPRAGVLSNMPSIMRLLIKSGRVANFKLKPISHLEVHLNFSPQPVEEFCGAGLSLGADPLPGSPMFATKVCGHFKQRG